MAGREGLACGHLQRASFVGPWRELGQALPASEFPQGPFSTAPLSNPLGLEMALFN